MEGSYRHTGSEGYEEYLAKVGVPWILRKVILAAQLILQVIDCPNWLS